MNHTAAPQTGPDSEVLKSACRPDRRQEIGNEEGIAIQYGMPPGWIRQGVGKVPYLYSNSPLSNNSTY